MIDGATTTVKVAHVRLCHSRMMFVRAYPRETQEMVFDAHDKAFAFFGGACTRGIYDNMKTAVDAIFTGRERAYNRRFQQMCGHYLVEPVACTPASGWEKGQVENQVGVVRRRFFAPRVRAKSYEELNAWLADRCTAWAKAHRHPEIPERTIREVFEAERSSLVPYRGPFAPEAHCDARTFGATASMPCPRPSRRPAWFASTRTSIRSPPRRSGVRWRSGPMPTGSRSARTAAWSAGAGAPSAAAGRAAIPGATCPCWPASRGR